jgi:hypothetical protein
LAQTLGSNDDGQNLITERYAKSNIVIQEQEASQIDSNRALPRRASYLAASSRPSPPLRFWRSLSFWLRVVLWLSRKLGQLSQMPIKSLAVLPFRQLAAEGMNTWASELLIR